MGICVQSSSLNSHFAACPAAEVSVSYSAYGVQIGFETTSALSRYLPKPLIPGGQLQTSAAETSVIYSLEKTHSPGAKLVFRVAENGIPVFSSPDVVVAARALESQAHQYLAENARGVVFVHAGVVAWQGKTILVPGPSHSGKSTLVMALVEAGATYYSDEYAVVDAEGLIHPFRRIPRLRPDVLTKESVALNLASGTALPPLPVGLVLNTRYNSTGTWQPHSLTAGEALLALLQNTVAVRRQVELTVRTLKSAVASAIALQTERTDAACAAQNILQSIHENWQLNAQISAELTVKE